MSHINVTINGRQYRMACEEGQEVRLLKLAESLETRIQSLRGKFGEIGDARLTVMAALTVCDELVDAGNRIRSMEQEGRADEAQIVFITHEAREADVQATLRGVRELDVVKRVGGLLRVVGA